MKEYRSKRSVEAAQWKDTDDARLAFTEWFQCHDMEFATRGPVIELDGISVQEGEWVVIDSYDDRVLVMTDNTFRRHFGVCTKDCHVENCSNKCGLPDLHDGLCACPRKIAALVTAGVTGAWQVADQTP